jgi:hypothetical protein
MGRQANAISTLDVELLLHEVTHGLIFKSKKALSSAQQAWPEQ